MNDETLDKLKACEIKSKELVEAARKELYKMRNKAKKDSSVKIEELANLNKEKLAELEAEINKDIEERNKVLEVKLEEELNKLMKLVKGKEEVVDYIVKAVANID